MPISPAFTLQGAVANRRSIAASSSGTLAVLARKPYHCSAGMAKKVAKWARSWGSEKRISFSSPN
jgi:hypothetical protein